MHRIRRVLVFLIAPILLIQYVPVVAATTCSDISQPLCASDGRTYLNPCFAQRAGASFLYEGACLSVPVGDLEKIDRAADVFLARVFFTTRDLAVKVKGYTDTLARFDTVATDRSLSLATRTALMRIRARFAEKGTRLLESHFHTFSETWFRLHLADVAPQPGVDNQFAITRFTWSPLRRQGGRLYSLVQVAFESRFEEKSASFDVVFESGNLRTLAILPVGEVFSLKKGVLARIAGSDVVVKIDSFVDSPCPAGAWCFWSGQSVETAWYRGGQVRRISDAGGAFGYQLETSDTDYKTYADVKIWPSQWNAGN